MAFTSGQWGPDTFIDNAGNTVLIGATVTASGYVCTVDALGNLTITGPATDALTVTVTPATGAVYTATVQVKPLVAEIESKDAAVQAAAVQRANHTGTQAQSTVTNLVSDLAAKLDTASATATYLSQAPGDGLTEGATKAELDAEAATARAAEAAKQPLDPDLTAFAALDSTTAGALATDGSGWVRKTYAQLKTALGLVKADVGLGNADNTSDADKPVSTAQQAAIAAAVAHVGVKATATSAQSIPTATTTTVALVAEDWDTHSFRSAGTPNNLVVPVGYAGKYHCEATVAFMPSATGRRVLRIHKNGVPIGRMDALAVTGVSSPTTLSCSVESAAVAGDVFTLAVYQDSGGALTLAETASGIIMNDAGTGIGGFISLRKVG